MQMIKVRRTMTEILLTVTNRQIEVICKEELQRFLKRHKGIIKLFSVAYENKLLRITANINRLFPDEKVKKTSLYTSSPFVFVIILLRLLAG